jgi:ABC-type nitrate/sulfonate/bicarbonate transport system substrate-binding protein
MKTPPMSDRLDMIVGGAMRAEDAPSHMTAWHLAIQFTLEHPDEARQLLKELHGVFGNDETLALVSALAVQMLYDEDGTIPEEQPVFAQLSH